MNTLTLVTSLLVVTAMSCGKDKTPSSGTSTPTTAKVAEPATAIKLGDATVYELVNRRWDKVDPPKRAMVLHADGTLEDINDKTDKPWMTFAIKLDGSVSFEGKPVGTISDRGVVGADGQVQIPLAGDTLSVKIDDKIVKVSLGSDGNVTVHDRPDGVKWRIDAADAAVRRTAFLALGLTMKTALD